MRRHIPPLTSTWHAAYLAREHATACTHLLDQIFFCRSAFMFKGATKGSPMAMRRRTSLSIARICLRLVRLINCQTLKFVCPLHGEGSQRVPLAHQCARSLQSAGRGYEVHSVVDDTTVTTLNGQWYIESVTKGIQNTRGKHTGNW